MTTPADAATASPLTRSQIVHWRTAVFVIFAMSGIGMASWFARTPAFRDALDASTLQMGFVVFALAFGSIFGLTLSSHAIARIGSRASITGSMVVAGVGLGVAGLGGDLALLPLVLLGLALFGFGTGLCDVAMNVEGAANERALGRTVMPLFHALFSVGTIVGALLGAAAEIAGLPIALHLGIIGVVMIAAVLVAVRYLQPDPFAVRPDRGHGRQGQGRLALPPRHLGGPPDASHRPHRARHGVRGGFGQRLARPGDGRRLRSRERNGGRALRPVRHRHDSGPGRRRAGAGPLRPGAGAAGVGPARDHRAC